MPARGIGFYGTLVERRPRTVQKGGRIQYHGKWFHHPRLLDHIGSTVMFDWGLGHLDEHYPVHECWTERVRDARSRFKRQHRVIQGEFICYAQEEAQGPSKEQT